MKFDLKKAFHQFVADGTYVDAHPYGCGHINDTFLINTSETNFPNYILQRINHLVFKDVPGLMTNIKIVTKHIVDKINAEHESTFLKECYTYLPSKENKIYYQDDEGNYWRLTFFIEKSKSFDVIDSPEKAYKGGSAYGQFSAFLIDCPVDQLKESIPDFHNIEWRLQKYYNSLNDNPCDRVKAMKSEIEFIKCREEEMKRILELGREGKIPLRITHNDTKFNNILFDWDNNALGVIDLDTVMPGYIHYDFGDAIRTGTNTASEDEMNLEKVSMDIQLFESFSNGFLAQTKSFLTTTEFENLAFSAKLLTFIMGLRFLTDYIDGDTYYKILHPKHNLQRAKTQFKLLQSMETQFEKMTEIILTMANLE